MEVVQTLSPKVVVRKVPILARISLEGKVLAVTFNALCVIKTFNLEMPTSQVQVIPVVSPEHACMRAGQRADCVRA